MKNTLRVVLILLMLLCVLVLVPSGAIVASAEIVDIPLDAKAGMPFDQAAFQSDWAYEDPSLSVTVETGVYEKTVYYAARIRIANPSQLRAVLSSGYNNPEWDHPRLIAKSANAVLAINGDFYAENKRGVMIRQGKLYRAFAGNTHADTGLNYDILVIDENGDLHILKRATQEDVDAFQQEHTIINSFNFGPGLVVDGVPQQDYPVMNNAANIPAKRTVIAQTGPLEYLCVCTEYSSDNKNEAGLTLAQLTDLIVSLGDVQNAYNLDGGSSAAMLFCVDGKPYSKVNARDLNRPLYDMICFTSAYVPD